jgi:hypothetical protein
MTTMDPFPCAREILVSAGSDREPPIPSLIGSAIHLSRDWFLLVPPLSKVQTHTLTEREKGSEEMDTVEEAQFT